MFTTYYDIPATKYDGDMHKLMTEAAKTIGASVSVQDVGTMPFPEKAEYNYKRFIFTLPATTHDSISSLMHQATKLGVAIGQALEHWDRH